MRIKNASFWSLTKDFIEMLKEDNSGRAFL
jgi:hypothetical protein